jgi:hypothetical protein
MCGFTSHIEFIHRNIDNLIDMPIRTFHGKLDNVVQFEETEGIIKNLDGKNKDIRFTADPDAEFCLSHFYVYFKQ